MSCWLQSGVHIDWLKLSLSSSVNHCAMLCQWEASVKDLSVKRRHHELYSRLAAKCDTREHPAGFNNLWNWYPATNNWFMFILYLHTLVKFQLSKGLPLSQLHKSLYRRTNLMLLLVFYVPILRTKISVGFYSILCDLKFIKLRKLSQKSFKVYG